MRREKQMLMLLWILRIFLVLNILFFIYMFYNNKYWEIYLILNCFLVLGYIWYNYIRLFIWEVKGKSNYLPLLEGNYTVVFPCYNESKEILEESIVSIVNQENPYKKELIIIDDGSTKEETLPTLRMLVNKFKNSYDIKLIEFPENRGKRKAHEVAISLSKYSYIISVDSDTVLDKKAIYYVLHPFSDNSIGATTGNILIKNEERNMLTRIQAGLYWIGLNLYKKGQSTQGNVMCCSGCLSAYRKTDLLEVLSDYVNQSFMGNICHASEDRHLTNLIHEKGMNVVYVEEAICYTEAPEKLTHFIKQQLRWKRGFYRESLYVTTYSWKKSKLMFLENLLFCIFTPFFNLSLRLLALYSMFFQPIIFITVLLPSWILYIFCRDSMFFIEDPKRAILYIPYVFLYNILLYPMNIYAIIVSEPEKWGTR